MLFTPVSLHKVCTKALLRQTPEADGFYVRGKVNGKDYAVSSHIDAWHRKKNTLSTHKILRLGESIIDIVYGDHDAVVAHPKSLPETGNYTLRLFLESVVKLYGKSPDPNTPVVFTTDGPRIVTPQSDPWLQEIFEDLRKRTT